MFDENKEVVFVVFLLIYDPFIFSGYTTVVFILSFTNKEGIKTLQIAN